MRLADQLEQLQVATVKFPSAKQPLLRQLFSVKVTRSWNLLPDHLKFAATFTFLESNKHALMSSLLCLKML